MPNDDPRRGRVRAAFVALAIFLPAQAAVAAATGARGQQAWPAVVMPGFARVPVFDKTIVLVRPTFAALLADGEVRHVPVRAVLDSIPESHHQGIMRSQFKPPSLSGVAGTDRGRRPDVSAWVHARVRDVVSDAEVRRVEVHWTEVHVNPGGQTRPADLVAVLALDEG